MKKKICFVIVNRANYGRIKNLLLKIKKKKEFQLQIILISSPLLKKYGKLENVIKKDGLKIDRKLYTHVEGENLSTMTKSTALALLELSSAFNDLGPDIVFTTGDRYETLATAIASSYMNIFLCHLQGGELTGSIDDNVRHAVTKLSHLHLASTFESRKRIIKMGENPKRVFNVGCPSIDLIKSINFKKKINFKNNGIGYKTDLTKPYYMVLLHPVTTSANNNVLINNVFESIKNLNEQVIWIWPNNDAGATIITKRIRSFREKYNNLKINFFINFEAEDYLKLLSKTKCLIGNSSSGIREASYLCVPAVNIGDRQNLRERGDNIIDCEINSLKITKAIHKATKKKKFIKNNIYGEGNSIDKILQILKDIKLDINKNFYE
jgi:bifunctional UDP-N-acetylglucosamine 2-epimerase / N-acetylmannosamine kinase